MAFKDTKLYSIFTSSCPRCHEGQLFKTKSAYQLFKSTEMNKTCEYCGENFAREPGFYFGAAYVSYGLTVAIWVAVFVAMETFDAIGLIKFSISEDPLELFLTGIITLIILLPWIYRISRAIWLNFFVKYDPEQAKEARNRKNSQAKD